MKASKYSLNHELLQFANRERKVELLLLLVLVLFIGFNLFLFLQEEKYSQLHTLHAEQEYDAQEAEYHSFLRSTAFLNASLLSDQMKKLEMLHANHIRLEQNRILLHYEESSLESIEPDIVLLRENFGEVKILQQEQQLGESRIIIEVSL